MRFIKTIFFLLIGYASFAQWKPYNVNMEVTGKFQANKQVYFPLNADSGKVWVCINDSTGLGEWRTVSGGGSTIDTSNFWNINGNSGTTGANFIGTTDSRDLVLKTNGLERARYYANGDWSDTNYVSQFRMSNYGSNFYNLGIPFAGAWNFDSIHHTLLFNGITTIGDEAATIHGLNTITGQESELSINYFSSINKMGILLKSQGTTGEDFVGIGIFDEVNVYCPNLSNDTIGFQVMGYDGVSDTIGKFKVYRGGSVQITDGTQGAGKVLTSDANGLAHWDTIPNNSAWILLATTTASASATVDFTGLTSEYSAYKVIYTDVVAATNGDAFWVRLGTGSTTWASGASDYAHGRYGIDVLGTTTTSTAFTTGDGTDSKIVAIGSQLNTLNYTTNGEIEIYNPSQSSKNHYITGKICAIYNNAGNANFVTGNFGAYYASTTAVTGIRILMSTGSITSGTFKIYGLK